MNAADRAALAAIAQTSLDAAKASLDAVIALPIDGAPSDPPPAEVDWATESAGALVAYEFASAGPEDANLTARHRSPGNTLPICYWVPNEDTYQKPVIDDYGMRFDVVPNKGSADCVVSLRGPYGRNSKLRLRWWARYNSSFINTVFRMADGGYPGIKLMIVATLDASSPSGKFVLTCIDQHKFPGGYRYNWSTGMTENFEPAIDSNASDYDWQPKQGQAPTCLYSVVNKTPQGVAVPGCDTLPADVWVLEELEIDTGDVVSGTDGKAWDCEYRHYMTVDGMRKLVFDYGKTTRGYQGRRAEPFTALWLVPFMTGRDLTQQFPLGTPSVWYKRLQVANGSQPSVDIDPNPLPDPTPSPTGALPLFTPTRDASGIVTNYAALPLRQWHEIADTKMVMLLPQLPTQSNLNDMNNVMASWGGSANDPATGDMHLHGGAHGANGQNSGFYTFNTDRADWRVTVPPLYMGPIEAAYLDKCAKLYYPNDPNAAYQGSWNMGMPPDFLFLPEPGSVTGDPTLDNPNARSSGRVFPHHCWWKMVWVEWMQRVFVSLMHLYLLDPKTGKIEVKQKHNDTDWQYNTADPVTKRIYGLTRAFSANEYWDFREYDPVADAPLVDYPLQVFDATGRKLDSATYSFSANNLQVTVGREIVHYNPITKAWFAFHMDTKKWRALPWQPLPFVSGAGDYAGVCNAGKILACQGWGQLYEVDPANGAVSALAVIGPAAFGTATTGMQNGLFGRLNLRGNLLFALDWATSNVKVMRVA